MLYFYRIELFILLYPIYIYHCHYLQSHLAIVEALLIRVIPLEPQLRQLRNATAIYLCNKRRVLVPVEAHRHPLITAGDNLQQVTKSTKSRSYSLAKTIPPRNMTRQLRPCTSSTNTILPFYINQDDSVLKLKLRQS